MGFRQDSIRNGMKSLLIFNSNALIIQLGHLSRDIINIIDISFKRVINALCVRIDANSTAFPIQTNVLNLKKAARIPSRCTISWKSRPALASSCLQQMQSLTYSTTDDLLPTLNKISTHRRRSGSFSGFSQMEKSLNAPMKPVQDVVAVPRASIENNLNAMNSPSLISAESKQDEDDIKARLSELVPLPRLADSAFGSMQDRTTADSSVLTRGRPEQKLFGYASEYLKQETTRLADGYKTLKTKRDAFISQLEEQQRKYDTAMKDSLKALSRAHAQKDEVLRKYKDAEQRAMNAKRQAVMAKVQLVKDAESATRAELASEEAKSSLQQAEHKREEAELKERDARKRADVAEAQAAQATRALQSAREEMSREIVAKTQELVRLRDEHAKDGSQNKHRLQETDRELGDCNRKLAEISQELKRAQEQLHDFRLQAQTSDAVIVNMREKCTAAESKLNSRDGSLERALQTLGQNQQFSQDRIDLLSKEKTKLEQRVDELGMEKSSLTEKLFESNSNLDRARDRVEQLNARLQELEKRTAEYEAKSNVAMEKLEEARAEAAAKTAKYGEARDAAERAVEQLNVERAHVAELIREVGDLKRKADGLESELVATKAAFEKSSHAQDPKLMAKILQESVEAESLKRQVVEGSNYKERAEHLAEELERVKKMLQEADLQRRCLLNEVQNLKGNIRVVARVRPPTLVIQAGKAGLEHGAAAVSDDVSQLRTTVDNMGLNLELRGNQQRRGNTTVTGQPTNNAEAHAFQFNRVFDRDATQHGVFEEVSQFVQSALDGYHVCLFSYGQTGSGKTWTMTGDLEDSLNRGIIPRSVDHILCTIAQMREKGWTYTMECTFIEIYNETARDLLALDPKAEKSAKHEIYHRGSEVGISGIRRVAVKESDQVHALLTRAAQARSVAATDKNQESSRSHSIFTINLIGRNHEKSNNAELVGSLSLCDLAGSERLKVSGATGDRMKETQAINTSLSALATVFQSLATKAGHIPFRNSLLTDLLSPCLSGEGKTLMIVNLSSDHDDAQETLCSLRFAQQVNKTELGKAKRNIKEVAGVSATGGASSAAIRGRNNSSN